MRPVAVRILHPGPDPAAGAPSRWVGEVRSRLAEHHRREFLSAGADDVAIVTGPPDDRTFGDRLRKFLLDGEPAGSRSPRGLVVLGSGSIPLATQGDRRAFVIAAGDEHPRALANNRYSADIVAISRVETLPEVPELPGDNALPRWLEEIAGYRVGDLRGRSRLAFDIDGPLDLVLLGAGIGRVAPADLAPVASRLAAIRAVAADRRSEFLVSGRTSASTLAWLERHSAARTRAWIEERGLRAASRLAQSADATETGADLAKGAQDTGRRPGSILGVLLERDGPASLGDILARFADAAIVDTRVLLAHRLGADEAGWPAPADRFASDLLLPGLIADPWLRDLAAAAVSAPIPILLGGHTLVGPGVPFLLDGSRTVPSWM